MDIIKKLLTPNRYSRPQTPLKKVKKVVIHYVANPKSTAQNNRDYFENLKFGIRNHYGKLIYVSAHYIVGLEGESKGEKPKVLYRVQVGAFTKSFHLQKRNLVSVYHTILNK